MDKSDHNSVMMALTHDKTTKTMTHIKFIFVILMTLMLTGCGHAPVHISTPRMIPPAPPLHDINVALVLGGGGARGVAHAGVLSVLEENNIPINLIVGTSIGSVVGALYADDPNSERLIHKLRNIKKWDVLDLNLRAGFRMFWGVGGLVEGHALRAYLQKHLKSHTFDQLALPLVVITTDIQRAKAVALRSGPIIPAVHASSAIPLVFEPVHLYQTVMVDGGVVSPVPVEIAKQLGAKKIIAVDIGNVVKPKKIKGTYELADRCLWLSYMALTDWQTRDSDVLIQPEFDSTNVFDDTKIEEYFESGRRAALDVLPQLKALLHDHESSVQNS